MTPWKWNDETNLWFNSITNETMTVIEYDNARCQYISKLKEENATLKGENGRLQMALGEFDDPLLTTEEQE